VGALDNAYREQKVVEGVFVRFRAPLQWEFGAGMQINYKFIDGNGENCKSINCHFTVLMIGHLARTW
jgi:hypothetical protein